jgi:OOP family OmpA-OmpF porin
VRAYLVAQGVDSSAVVAKGFGDTKPVASNDTEEGKFQNRRIEFTAVR